LNELEFSVSFKNAESLWEGVELKQILSEVKYQFGCSGDFPVLIWV